MTIGLHPVLYTLSPKKVVSLEADFEYHIIMEHLHAIAISEFMTRDLIVLGPDETMADAYQKMHSHHIRHLPVVDDEGNITGIFTQEDLQRAYPAHETESGWYYDKRELELLNLRHFMSSSVTTLTPENTLKEASEIMIRNKYGCIPIVSAGSKKLIGIVSYIDILKKIDSLF